MNLVFRESKTLDLDQLVQELHGLATDIKLGESLFGQMISSVDRLITQQEINKLSTLPKTDWIDYLEFRYKYKTAYFAEHPTDFPQCILIEPASLCNLQCKMCWHVDDQFHNDKKHMGMMSYELFTQIVDEAVRSGAKSITMASRGEPTLNPHFSKMLDYVGGKVFEVKFNTNAIRLRDDVIHSALRSNIDIAVFSIDTNRREIYQHIRGKDKFEIVVRNIKRFNEIRSSDYPNSNTTTRIHGVRYEDSIKDDEFFSFWGNLADEVSIGPCNERWDIYNYEPNSESSVCEFLDERMYVWWDGRCNPCDPDYKSCLSIGTFSNSKSLKEIWNGPEFKKLRRLHRDGRRGEIFPCRQCPVGAKMPMG